jgi:hypothetical protein
MTNEPPQSPINPTVPNSRFISLQLHMEKSGKSAEIGVMPVDVKVHGRMGGSGIRWILVEIGAKSLPIVSLAFPHI